jgi:hypothetical protein
MFETHIVFISKVNKNNTTNTERFWANINEKFTRFINRVNKKSFRFAGINKQSASTEFRLKKIIQRSF